LSGGFNVGEVGGVEAEVEEGAEQGEADGGLADFGTVAGDEEEEGFAGGDGGEEVEGGRGGRGGGEGRRVVVALVHGGDEGDAGIQ
jgi:hypothetical protein